MDSSTKKRIYGLLLFFIVCGVGVWFYFVFLKPAPSCTDGIQNQNEEGIDCGGICGPCEVKELKEIRVASEPKIFFAGNGDVKAVLAEILNPNAGYKAHNFSYEFLIYDADGHIIETIEGESSIGASERKFIFEDKIASFWKSIARVSLEIHSPEWEKSFEGLRPSLSLSEGPETNIANNEIKVSGTVKNTGTASVVGVKIIAVLFDSYGKQIFASQTDLSSVQALEERPFIVFFPNDPNLAKTLDPDRTRVFIEGE